MKKHCDLDFLWLLFLAGVTALFWLKVEAKEARTIRLDDKKIAPIYVRVGHSTILSFPVKPAKVVVGNTGAFSVQYIENDLAISPLVPGVSSNVFVYLQGRRFGFDLVPNQGSDEIVIVRDMVDKSVPVRIQNE